MSAKRELTAQFLWRSSVWPLPPIHLLGSWRAPWLRIAAAVWLLWRSSSGDLSVNNESLSWSQWSADSSAKEYHGVGIWQSQWSLQAVRLLVWAIRQNRWLYKLVLSWDSFYKPLWLTDWIQTHRPTVFLQQCHHHLFHLQHLRNRRRSCHQNMESKSFTSKE